MAIEECLWRDERTGQNPEDTPPQLNTLDSKQLDLLAIVFTVVKVRMQTIEKEHCCIRQRAVRNASMICNVSIMTQQVLDLLCVRKARGHSTVDGRNGAYSLRTDAPYHEYPKRTRVLLQYWTGIGEYASILVV